MPTHFHWIISRDEKTKGTVSGIMRDIKKYSAWDIIETLSNYEENFDLLKLFQKTAINFKNHKHKFWMPRFHDEGIRNREMLATKIEYIHYNPVKAGLCSKPEDYKYSSARNYFLDDQSVLYVDTELA